MDRKMTTETRKWLYDLKVQMLKNKDGIARIRNNFVSNRHCLSVNYYWLLPGKELVTKKGSINLRSGDWSNFPKIPDDMVFNEVLGIDDGAVCRGTVYQLHWNGKSHLIIIDVEIHEIDILWKKSEQLYQEIMK